MTTIDLSALRACASALRQALEPSGVVPDAEMLADFLLHLDQLGWQVGRNGMQAPSPGWVDFTLPATPAGTPTSPIASSYAETMARMDAGTLQPGPGPTPDIPADPPF